MRYFSFIILLIFSFYLPVFAQNQTVDVSLSLIPNNPEPGSIFSVKAISYGVDLNQASIVWTYNNKVVASGTGKTSISLTAPSAGANATIGITVSGLGFDQTFSSIDIKPGSVDILWESVDGYTPAFYKGKTLLSSGGSIKVGVAPTSTNSKYMTYSWSRNDSAMQNMSGYGKSTIVFKNNLLKTNEKIKVLVSGGSFSGENTLSLPITDPKIISYQDKNDFIKYDKGWESNIEIVGEGALIRFEPYFFSVPNSVPKDLSIEYSDNDNLIPTDPGSLEIGVSKPENSIFAKIKVGISTVIYSLQNIEKIFTIKFN